MLTSVSDYTKGDIVATFALDAARAASITKVPNSIVCDFSAQSPVKALERKKYILDLNAYIEKKNPMTLLRAFDAIRERTDATLVFCGGYKDEALFKAMQDFITQKGMDGRVQLLFRMGDEERNWLLSHAALFVTPSLFEGFGRTPVEAAICGVPVVSTKETSLHEATMGLCNYVEHATDAEELATLLLAKLQQPDDATALADIAQKLTEHYAPDALAETYWKLYEKVAATGR